MVEREAEGAWVRVRKSQLCLKRTISFVEVGEGVRGRGGGKLPLALR